MTAAHPEAPDPAATFAALRRLPEPVEAWWVAQAREAARGAAAEHALRALAPEVQRLSDAFTCARPVAFADYARTPAERAAYGLFYFPQTWVRARFPLAEARVVRGWAPPSRSLRLLDVGAGSGAAGLSLATALRSWGLADDVTLSAVDHAPEALGVLSRLAREALPAGAQPRARTVVADVRTPGAWPADLEGPFHLVVASFVLNEVFPAGDDAAALAWLRDLAARLTPDGLLLVLEPGTQEAAYRLVGLAASAAEQGLHPWGPQLHAGPWRPRKSRATWPHEVRRWQPPRSLQVVNRTLWRSIGELTFSYALLGRTAPAPLEATPRLHRLCSPVRVLKGRLTWLGLGADGTVAEYEVQDRDMSRDERERFLAVERGDVLEVATLLPLGRPYAWRLPAGSALLRHLSPG